MIMMIILDHDDDFHDDVNDYDHDDAHHHDFHDIGDYILSVTARKKLY